MTLVMNDTVSTCLRVYGLHGRPDSTYIHVGTVHVSSIFYSVKSRGVGGGYPGPGYFVKFTD